jgi:hypothetical protein
MQDDDAPDAPVADLRRSVEEAGAAFARVVAQASYRNGEVAWPREIVLAQQKIDEAVMWALRALRRPSARDPGS